MNNAMTSRVTQIGAPPSITGRTVCSTSPTPAALPPDNAGLHGLLQQRAALHNRQHADVPITDSRHPGHADFTSQRVGTSPPVGSACYLPPADRFAAANTSRSDWVRDKQSEQKAAATALRTAHEQRRAAAAHAAAGNVDARAARNKAQRAAAVNNHDHEKNEVRRKQANHYVYALPGKGIVRPPDHLESDIAQHEGFASIGQLS
jgi:hypothetical protein